MVLVGKYIFILSASESWRFTLVSIFIQECQTDPMDTSNRRSNSDHQHESFFFFTLHLYLTACSCSLLNTGSLILIKITLKPLELEDVKSAEYRPWIAIKYPVGERLLSWTDRSCH